MHAPSNLAGQPLSAGYPLRGRNTKHPKHDRKLCVASWNVRTLLDNANNPQRIIGRELERCGIDIAALSETRIHGETQLEEVGAGYTFFLIGHPLMDLHKPEWDLPSALHSHIVFKTGQLVTYWLHNE